MQFVWPGAGLSPIIALVVRLRERDIHRGGRANITKWRAPLHINAAHYPSRCDPTRDPTAELFCMWRYEAVLR